MPPKSDSGAVWNPFTAKSRAERSAEEMYPGKIGQDDQRDAARHMLASGYLAKAWGPGIADLIGRAHEFKETPFRHLGALAGMSQYRYDRPIDLHNNALGIELAQKARDLEEFERLVNAAAERARPTQTPGAPWVPAPKEAEAMRKGSAQYQKGGVVKGAFKHARSLLDDVLYHGGSYKKGETITQPLYMTPERAMAESYADPMRVPGAKLQELRPDVKNPAPERLVNAAARKFVPENKYFTPASAFDPNLHDPDDIAALIRELERRGYDSAVAGDVGMGGNYRAKGDALVVFPGKKAYAGGGVVTDDHTQPDMADGGRIYPDPNLYAGGGLVAAFKDGGAATGFFPQMKPRRTRQDREAAKDMPVAAARGALAGVLGAPGDIESLVRMLPGLDESRTILPTSEDIERRLPLKSASASPAGRAATGLGTLAGGFYTGPGAPVRLVGALPRALGHGATEFAHATAGAAPHVIKNKGGNFIDESIDYFVNKLKNVDDPEKTLQDLAKTYQLEELAKTKPALAARIQRHIAELEPEVALNQWIQQKVRPYVKNQMGTPEDPIRKLIEQGVYHMPEETLHMMGFLPEEVAVARKRYGFPEEGMAVQKHAAEGFPEANDARVRAAEGWEAATDTLLDPKHASEFRGQDVANNPWLSKLDPNAPVHDIRMYESPRDYGFDHILDVLREDITAGRIRPEQLSKITMEQAVRRTYQYDQEMAKKVADARAAAREGLPVYKEYPEGYRWVELNKPGAFTSESEAMGHSVRGYEPPKGHPDWTETSGELGSLGYGHGGWEGIKSGRAKVYSLVDAKGQPHVTVEARRGATTGDLMEDIDRVMESLTAAERKKFNRFLGSDDYDGDFNEAVNWMQENMPAAYQKYMSSVPSTYEITQIKGKQNARPKDEYLPFVQDFVRSSGHDVVGDIGNAGLRDVQSWINPDTMAEYRKYGIDVPKFATDDELDALHKLYESRANPPEGYAGGGSVKTGIKEGVNLARRSLFGLKPSAEMKGRELVPVQRDLDRMQAELNKAERAAPKVEKRSVTIDPGKGSAKVTDVVQKVAETPVSRRTVLKSAASQVAQHAMPAHSFADLMKPAEVAKEVVQAVAPVVPTASMVPALMAKAIKKGMDADEAVAFVRGELGKNADNILKQQDTELLYDTLKNPFESILDDPDWLYKHSNGERGELMGPGELLQTQLGLGVEPGSLKETLRGLKAEMSPEDYANMKNAMKDAINQEMKYGGDY